MTVWYDWPLERMLYLFLGAAYALLWLQLTLMHWRGGFHNRIMWGPVVVTPMIAATAFVMSYVHGGIIDATFVVIFSAGILVGLVGTAMHLKADAAQVGGLTLHNLMSGPPPILPLIYAAMSGLGLAIHYWPAVAGAS